MKKKAMHIVRNMSNDELEEALQKFGQDVSVNFITRGTVESRISEKLDEYSDDDIRNFINKYL